MTSTSLCSPSLVAGMMISGRLSRKKLSPCSVVPSSDMGWLSGDFSLKSGGIGSVNMSSSIKDLVLFFMVRNHQQNGEGVAGGFGRWLSAVSRSPSVIASPALGLTFVSCLRSAVIVSSARSCLFCMALCVGPFSGDSMCMGVVPRCSSDLLLTWVGREVGIFSLGTMDAFR